MTNRYLTLLLAVVSLAAVGCCFSAVAEELALPITVKGDGAVSFHTSDRRWREKVKGFVAKGPAFYSVNPGTDQLRIVVWQGTKVRYYVTDGVRELIPGQSDGASGIAMLKAGPADPAVLGVPLESAKSGVIRDLRVFDHALVHHEAMEMVRAWRKATLTLSAHFGTEDVEKKLVVSVAAGRVKDLAGATLELADGSGKAVEPPRTVTADGAAETFVTRLPFGDYVFRLRKGNEILAEEKYGVLRRENPVVLSDVSGTGRPARMELVRTIRPDPAAFAADEYRSVGKTHFGSLNGVRYLETGDGQHDRFAIRFKVDTNTPLHCLEFDYPDDKKRTMDIVVQCSRARTSDYTLGVGVATGGEEYRCQNRILTHRCLFWTPSDEDVSVVVMAFKKCAPAALSEIRLYKVTDAALPPAEIREPPANDRGLKRYIGQFWEDPAVTRDFRIAHGNLTNLNQLIDRHIAQMRYSGQNMLAYPGIWYKGLVGRDGYDVRGHRKHFLEAYYEKFDRANLMLMPTVEYLSAPQGLAGFDAASPTNGALHGTMFSIRANGEAVNGWHGAPPNHCVAHPAVQAEVERMIAALADEGKDHPSFKGVTLFLPIDTSLWWGSLASGYNDYCIDAFVRSLKGLKGLEGLKGLDELESVDRREPLRGREYARIITGDPALRAKWVQWRCDVVTDFYVRLAKILSDRRPDLQLRLDLEPPVDAPRELEAHPDYYADTHRARVLREAGIDAEALRRIPNLVFGMVVFNVRQRKRDYWLLDPKVRERYIREPETASWWRETVDADYPQVVIRDDFWETDVGAKAKGARALNCDWFKEITWRVSALLPSDRNVMKYYALPLRYGDVMGVSHGAFLISDYGMEEHEVAFAKAFRALPAVKMADVPASDAVASDVRVRHCTFGGKSYFYFVNTADRPVRLVVRMPPQTTELATGRPAGDAEVELTMKPYELWSFAAPEGRPAWRIGPEGVDAAVVDNRFGTDRRYGSCVLGPCVPHGSVHPSPDSVWPPPKPHPTAPGQRHGAGAPTSGWWPGDPVIGFSQLHCQGTGGCPSYGIFRFDITPSSMEIEESHPYCFRAALPEAGMKVGIVPTAHGALYRIASATVKPSQLVLNRRCKLAVADCVNKDGAFTGNWNPAPYRCYAECEPDDAAGLIRVAVSFKSQEQAKEYLRRELAGRRFEDVAAAAKAQWDGLLSRIRIEGVDAAERRRFYGHFMHTLVQPRDRAEDGIGWDDHYTLWDTWRTLYPLLSLVDPATVAGVVNSFGERFAQSSCCETGYTSGKEFKTGQGGDEADVVIADAVVKRLPGLDAAKLVPLLESRWTGRTRAYRERGYALSEEREDYCWRFKGGSATMSFAWEDWCVGTALNALGKDGSRFLARSANWTNLWDAACTDQASGIRGFVRARKGDGRFGGTQPREGFNTDFYEANCWEYSLFVMQDFDGMIARCGGREAFVRRLEYAHENGIIDFGNEPSFQAPWLFALAGRPDLTVKWARRLAETFPSYGCPGDDDSGAMGALYVFLKCGFFPLAGRGVYVLHGSAYPRIELTLPAGGRKLVIVSENLSPENRHLAAVSLNGRTLSSFVVGHDDLAAGGVLKFVWTK